MKQCPKCEKVYPNAEKFCPVDGQLLSLLGRLPFGLALGAASVWLPIREAQEHDEKIIYIRPQFIITAPVLIACGLLLLFKVRSEGSGKIVAGLSLTIGILAMILLVVVLRRLGYPLKL